MSYFNITEKYISSKIDIKGKSAVTESIKYPSFESTEEKFSSLCTKLSRFYSVIAAKYSSYARHGLVKKISRNPQLFSTPVNLSMNYTVTNISEKVLSVVIDLCFSRDGKIRMRRFSQVWDTDTAKLLRAGSLFKLTMENKKTISDYIKKEAETYLEKHNDCFDNALSKVQKHFCFNNCFITPNGISFYFDAGLLRAEKYGPVCFIVPFSGLSGILCPPLASQITENTGDL